METKSYESPVIADFGTLVEMTAACVGGGGSDESFKGYEDPFQQISPAFGDPAFCTP